MLTDNELLRLIQKKNRTEYQDMLLKCEQAWRALEHAPTPYYYELQLKAYNTLLEQRALVLEYAKLEELENEY